MAVSSADLVKAALEVVYTALAAVKTDGPAKAGVQALNEVATSLNQLAGYQIVNIALTADSDDAGVSEFVAAEATISVGTVFRVTTATFDFTDNALATASGGAVAIGDVFTVSGADAVVFMGNNEGRAFDMSGETTADFG